MTAKDGMTTHFAGTTFPHLHRNDQAVFEALQTTDQHPTAIELYEMVRQNYPRIGRATVYRALQRLEAAGIAIQVGRDSRGCHYDARIARHDHAICSQCGRLFDLAAPGSTLSPEALAEFYRAAEAVGLKAETWEMRVYGRCADCQNEHAPTE